VTRTHGDTHTRTHCAHTHSLCLFLSTQLTPYIYQELVRKRISENVLQGRSLLTPCPPMLADISSPLPQPKALCYSKEIRSTLFDHVALPSPLPQSLCDSDVRDFEDLNTWEDHLRQTKPWLENQESSTTASLISGASVWNSNNPSVEERREARTLDRSNSAVLLLESCANADPKPKKLSSSSKRATFESLPTSRKNSRRSGGRSVHNPNNKQMIVGLGVLLSYLIEEPPDFYVKNLSWDIFSVPGDKTKLRRPVTEMERAKSAGDSVIRSETVSEFLESLYKMCKWTSECHIIAFILMVRCVLACI